MTTPDNPVIELTLEPAPGNDLGQQKKRNRRLAAILVSACLVMVLGVGAGAFAGYQFLLGGAQPGERLPASLMAYASIDLKPGLDQQRRLLDLARKFPKTGNADSAEQMVTNLLKKLDIDDVDAEKDLASWVGLRASAGLWMYEKRGYVLLAIATKDDAQASAALKRLTEKPSKTSVGWWVEDGVATIAAGPSVGYAAVKAAVAEAKEHPFTESERYAEARKWLGDDHVGTLWMDLTRLTDLTKVLSNNPTEQKMMVDALKNGATKPIGTFAMGVRATDYGVEAHYRTFGYDNREQGKTGAIDLLGAQPADSDIAALMAMPDLKELTKSLGADGSVKPLTLAERATLTELLSKDELTPAEESLVDDLIKRAGAVQSPLTTVRPFLDALSGATLVASGSNLRGNPAFSVTAQLASAANANALRELEMLFPAGGPKLTVDGTTVTVTGGDHGKSGEKLASKAEFKTVTEGAPQQVQLAVYVNTSALMTVKERDEIGPIKAFGLFAGYDGKEIVGSMRMLVG